MIAYLEGKIITGRSSFIILEVNGVGYKVFCNNSQINQSDKTLFFFIHHHTREDINDLYGFKSFEELELFEKLISVNGIGPKAGMSIMSFGSASKIIQAIVNSDASFFTAVPGIGKKVAAKIILDLKSKISGGNRDVQLDSINYSDEVSEALLALGYKREEIGDIIGKIPSDLGTAEEKVRWCLKNLKK